MTAKLHNPARLFSFSNPSLARYILRTVYMPLPTHSILLLPYLLLYFSAHLGSLIVGCGHCFRRETKNNLYVIKAPWCMHVKRSTIMSTHMHIIMPGDLCNLKHWKQIANHFNSRTKRRPLIFVSSWCESYCQSHRPKSEHGIHSSSTAFHEMTSTSKGSICNAHIHKPKTCVCLSPSWRRRIIIKDCSIIIKNLTIRWENILLAELACSKATFIQNQTK